MNKTVKYVSHTCWGIMLMVFILLIGGSCRNEQTENTRQLTPEEQRLEAIERMDSTFLWVQSHAEGMQGWIADSLARWDERMDSLSAEDQEMFMEAGLEASKWAYQYSKDTDAENRAYLETVMTVIDVDRNVWKAFAEETNAPFMEKYTEVAKLKK